MWKITAGRSNVFVADFLDENYVAIGWSDAGDYTNVSEWDDLIELFSDTWPDNTKRQNQVGAGQVWRFLKEMAPGDDFVTYDPSDRQYHLGKIDGHIEYRPDLNESLPVRRSVTWFGQVGRDSLSEATRNTLGAILTLFKLSDAAEQEILAAVSGKVSSAPVDPVISEPPEVLDPYSDIEDTALEKIKDRINRLDWQEMQDLVAALLRSLGYRTVVSSVGPDRGKDIIASKDGFGFERPRIVVEVKHRPSQKMGSQEIRSFLGGRHQDDRGLYVSTGGFSRDAMYEAERASTVTHLMTLDELAKAIIDQYDQIDEEGRRLLPLTKVYWPG